MNISPHIPVSKYPLAPDVEMTQRIRLGHGIFERLSFEKFMRHTRPRDVAVDVGAHVGSWALGLSKLFGGVVAFEPNPVNRNYLKKNLRVANATNVVVLPFAVTNDTKQHFRITAVEATRNSGQSHLVLSNESGDNFAVQCVQLDDTLKAIASKHRINAIKVDVEGMELGVIKSGAILIKEHKPTILLEINGLCERYGVTGDEILDHMSDIGYRSVDNHRYDFIFKPKRARSASRTHYTA